MPIYVQVLNLTNKQIETIRSEMSNPRWNPQDVIGMIYEATILSGPYDYELKGWGFGHKCNGWMYKSQVRVVNYPTD